MQQWTACDGQLPKTASRWSDGRLGNVTMDSSRWTAQPNRRLGNGWLGDERLRLGDKVLDGSALSRCTACNGQRLAMDGLAIKHWTAKYGRLGNGRLGDGQLCDNTVGSMLMDDGQCLGVGR